MESILVKKYKEERDELREQLAKVNERVEELEGQLHLTILTTHEASFESDYGKKRLNKFAIENQAKGVEDFYNWLDEYPESHVSDDAICKYIEQLRKE